MLKIGSHVSQRPDRDSQRPDDIAHRPGNVSQGPGILAFWQDIQVISGFPSGVSTRLRRAPTPSKIKPSGLYQSARCRWLNARRGRIARSYLAFRYSAAVEDEDRKSTRLNSSHVRISYAVF